MIKGWEALRRRDERGEGKIGPIIGLIVVALIIYTLVMYVPVKVRGAQFEEDVERYTRDYVINEIDYEEMITEIIRAGAAQDIDISEEDIEVDDTNKRVRTEVFYEVTVGMIWGDWVIEGHVDAEVPRL